VLGASEHDRVPNYSEMLGNFSLHSVYSPMLTYEVNDLWNSSYNSLLSSLVKAATDGICADEFFGDARTPLGYGKRLRAVVQNVLSDFAEDMSREGYE
jgi:hypothetical protein